MNERTIPYSEDFRRLILRMLQKDPRKRPTIFEVSDMVDSLLRKTLPQDDTDDEDLQVLIKNKYSKDLKLYTVHVHFCNYPLVFQISTLFPNH